jgi:hypothetical protein
VIKCLRHISKVHLDSRYYLLYSLLKQGQTPKRKRDTKRRQREITSSCNSITCENKLLLMLFGYLYRQVGLFKSWFFTEGELPIAAKKDRSPMRDHRKTHAHTYRATDTHPQTLIRTLPHLHTTTTYIIRGFPFRTWSIWTAPS